MIQGIALSMLLIWIFYSLLHDSMNRSGPRR